MYSIDGLKNGIENSKRNISSLETAIEAERQTIADYKIMIANLERAESRQEEAKANVHIEVERDSTH